MAWIVDWSEISERAMYLVCPLISRQDKSLYLGQPSSKTFWMGKEVKRLMVGCYAALEIPELKDFPFSSPEDR